MKKNHNRGANSRRQPINECLRALPEARPAHSNGKPDVPSTINNIDVRFAPNSSLQITIKYPMNAIPSLNQTPFADLMRHPEKLEAALRAAKNENDAFAASRIYSRGAYGNDPKDKSLDAMPGTSAAAEDLLHK